MKSRNYLIMPVIIATIFMACSALQMKGIYDARSEKEIFLRTLKRFPMESKRKMEELKFYRFLEAIKSDSTAGAFFSILQATDATDSVKVDSLKSVFYKRKDLETWPDTPDTNEWRGEALKRMDYCDKNYSSPFFGQVWNIMAKPVLLYGPPDEKWEEEDTCWALLGLSNPPQCAIYYMRWIKIGYSAAYQDRDGDGIPDEQIRDKYDQVANLGATKRDQVIIVGRDVAKFVTLAKPVIAPRNVEWVIKASLSVASFLEPLPESLTYITTWVSFWLPLGQFKPDTSGNIYFHISTIIRDADSYSVIVQDSGMSLYMPVKGDVNQIPLYAKYNLPKEKGRYILTLTIKDNHGGLGIYQTEFQRPGSISDILVSKIPPSQDTLLAWISRWGTEIMDMPFAFAPGDTMYLYFEFQTKDFASNTNLPDSQYAYLATFKLYPVETGKKTPEVKTGKIYVVKEGVKIEIPEEELGHKKEGYLIYSSAWRTRPGTIIFEVPRQVPDVPEGDYVLIASIRDVNSPTSKTLLSARYIHISSK